MTTPYLRIVEPGVVASWALEDKSEGEFREVLALLSRLSPLPGSPGGRQMLSDLQVLETWLRALKAARDEYVGRTGELDVERQRLRDEILEVRRREGWDPGAARLRLQLDEALHRLHQDVFKLGEACRRAELEAKKGMLEAYSRIKNQFGQGQELPPVRSLLAFLECDAPRRVLVIHEPEPLDGTLPPRVA